VSVGDQATPTTVSFQRAVASSSEGASAVVRRGDAEVRIEITPELRRRALHVIGAGKGERGIVVSPPAADVPSSARSAGVGPGSTVTAVDGIALKTFADLTAAVGRAGAAGTPLKLTWKPLDGPVRENVEITPFPDTNASADQLGLGAAPLVETIRSEGIADAFVLGVDRTHRWSLRILGTLRALFTGDVSARNLQGPIAIAQASFQTAREGWTKFFLFLGIISMNLAVMNLLPVPVLDGGQIVVVTIERILGRRLPLRVVEIVQIAGLVILLGFMVFVVVNDFVNLF
jgi:regulator of sigma E protease